MRVLRAEIEAVRDARVDGGRERRQRVLARVRRVVGRVDAQERAGALEPVGLEAVDVAAGGERAPRGVALYDRVRQDYRVLTPVSMQIPIRLRT